MSKVQINYKSGHLVVMSVESFKFKKDGNGTIQLEWTMDPKAKTLPLYVNVDEIESIWEIL